MAETPPEQDPNGYMRYSIGLTAVIVTVTFVAGANGLSQMAQTGSLPAIAFLSPKGTAPVAQIKSSRFDNIDFGATGTVQNFLKQPVILDPCTGRQKQ